MANRSAPSRAFGQAGVNQTNHAKRLQSSAPGRHDASTVLPKSRVVGPGVDVLVGGVVGPGTAAAATDIVTINAHGLTAGRRIQFTTLTGGTGLNLATDYYVLASNLAANTFQVSLTPGGAVVDITLDYSAISFQEHTFKYPQAGAWNPSADQAETKTAVPNRNIGRVS